MWLSIIIIVFGLLGSAFISATEVALLGSRRFRISRLAEEGDQRADAVLKVLGDNERFFGTILLVGNIFNIMVASVGTSLAIATIGGGEPSAISTIVATIIELGIEYGAHAKFSALEKRILGDFRILELVYMQIRRPYIGLRSGHAREWISRQQMSIISCFRL